MPKTIQSINPYSGEINAEFELLNEQQLEAKIEKAQEAFLEWKETSFDYRKKMFHKLADVIDADVEKYAKLQTIEMWMLLWSSINGLKWTANLIRWFANNAEKVLGKKEYDIEWTKWTSSYDPLGVIFGIAPWNFPYNQLLRAAVPNMLAWNTMVYKHASNVPLCAAQIEDFFVKAWFPEWVYTNVFMSSSLSEQVIAHPHVRGVNLTGWEYAGSVIGALAWKYLKPSILELWWNDPLLLLDHEDTQKMVSLTQSCRFNDGGQRCNSSKRFIVLDKHYDEFVESMKEFVEWLTYWDPLDATTTIQPLAKANGVAEIDSQVQKSIEQWAELIIGWKIVGEQKTTYAPTILANVQKWMTCYEEEIFGPVMSIIKSSSVEESIQIANDSDFWLSAVVFGDDTNECIEVANKLIGGMIFINQPAWSKAHLPFGWVKKSGYGKENGAEWLKAFTNKKVLVY